MLETQMQTNAVSIILGVEGLEAEVRMLTRTKTTGNETEAASDAIGTRKLVIVIYATAIVLGSVAVPALSTRTKTKSGHGRNAHLYHIALALHDGLAKLLVPEHLHRSLMLVAVARDYR